MKVFSRALILFSLFVASAFAAHLMTPQRSISEVRKESLGEMFPEHFGRWSVDAAAAPVVVAQDVQENLDKFYSDILTRTYVSEAGQRIMLSIAYGADQSRTNQVHKPEVCYPAQGFEIVAKEMGAVQTAVGPIPVMRLSTRLGQRFEPVTYWILIGDRIVRGVVEQNVARIQFGLNGAVPDGLLFRVSSIDRDTVKAYQIQSEFIAEALSAMRPATRVRFIGTASEAPGR